MILAVTGHRPNKIQGSKQIGVFHAMIAKLEELKAAGAISGMAWAFAPVSLKMLLSVDEDTPEAPAGGKGGDE